MTRGHLAEMQGAYDRAAPAWAHGADAVYEQLASAALAGIALGDARVVDVGAGTSAAGRLARRAGAAQVVPVDLSEAMLRAAHSGDTAPVGLVGDATALPLASERFDVCLALCLLSHLVEPAAGLVEMRRILRPGGALVATSFSAGEPHPAKQIVDRVMAGFGFRAPAWYRRMKAGAEAIVDDPVRLAALATGAGFASVSIVGVSVSTGMSAPADLVAWRVGMAHLAPFVARMDGADRTRALREAQDALAGAPPLVVDVNVATATR